ncbi:MAG: DUF1887 family protein [Clostridia bacterium]|nr:DUF1887 family protein [Clostridia bacterium]
MQTLIELYDPSPINNVLSSLMFQPKEMILLCPPESAEDREFRRSLRAFFQYMNCPVRVTFVSVSLLDARSTERVLGEILASHNDCAIDISGGTDASLFAAGACSGDTAVFTYSRKRNAFYEIKNASFARSLPCTVRLDVAGCLKMAGGTLLPGREDHTLLRDRLEEIDRLFRVYSLYRRIWNGQISFIQKISSAESGDLEADGPLRKKAGNKMVQADPDLFRELAEENLIQDLQILEDRISFRFPDETVRFWLRDIGAVLELQVFRACHLAGCFDDVVLSAVVNWQGGAIHHDSVTNEIDVMAVQGISPVFISCKTCEVHTEALNELAILRDRFGGKYARALLVTSGMATKTRANMRMRAVKLGIELVEWENAGLEQLINCLRRD